MAQTAGKYRAPRAWENTSTIGSAVADPLSPAPVARKPNHALRYGIVAIGSIAVILLMVVVPQITFHPQMLTFGPYQREVGADALTASDIFSPENMLKYEDKGAGFKASFAQVKRGVKVQELSVELPTATNAKFTGGARKRAIVDAQNQLQAALKAVNTDPDYAAPYFFIADVTEGMYPELRKQIKDTFQGLGLEEKLSNGAGVDFYGFKITKSDIAYENAFPSVLLPKVNHQREDAKVKDDLTKINASLDWLTSPHKSENNTSVMTALFKDLAQAGDEHFANIYLFSDFLENSPGYTFTMYSGRGRELLEDDKPSVPDNPNRRTQKYEELEQMVQKYFQVPDLHGMHVEIHTPSRGSADLIHRSIAFMKWLLEKHGARVKVV